MSDEEDDPKTGKGKSRRELPAGAVATLKAWLLSPEHFTHPYPTPQDQIMLMQKTGIDKKQLKNWFTNARRRIWKPMLKKQLEQGKLAVTGAGGGGVVVPGVVPGLMTVQPPGLGQPPQVHTGVAQHMAATPDNPHSISAMHAHYQQAVQQHGQDQGQQQQQQQPQQQPQQQTQQYDQYGNLVYVQSAPCPAIAPTPTAPIPAYNQTYTYTTQVVHPAPHQAPMPTPQQQQTVNAPTAIPMSSSIGTLPQVASNTPVATFSSTLNKTDSHAVLMELFARDQDLVKQATEAAKIKATVKGSEQNQQQVANQHPMKISSNSKIVQVPTLNSWPHFSSISSLNNLGSMTGVKSITSMSGVDLANQGNLNLKGNLAQVKSIESMGRNDSYAFLEVFFGDKTVNQTTGREQRGVKREREEDNDVGLSLDADESPSATTTTTDKPPLDSGFARHPAAPIPAPLPGSNVESKPIDSGTLKRAYDDALAARGLISVSRSSENLSGLALPAKMQRTLSQEFLRHHQVKAQAVQAQQQQQQQQQQQPQSHQQQYTHHVSFTQPTAPAPQATTQAPSTATSQQYPGQHPGQYQQVSVAPAPPPVALAKSQAPVAAQTADGEVKVPADAVCARCNARGVDAQLKPCGHMFHERCLKPSLQTPGGPPKCPIDGIPIESVLVAVQAPETTDSDSAGNSQQIQPSYHQQGTTSNQQAQQQQQQQQQQHQNEARSWNAPAPSMTTFQTPAIQTETGATQQASV